MEVKAGTTRRSITPRRLDVGDNGDGGIIVMKGEKGDSDDGLDWSG